MTTVHHFYGMNATEWRQVPLLQRVMLAAALVLGMRYSHPKVRVPFNPGPDFPANLVHADAQGIDCSTLTAAILFAVFFAELDLEAYRKLQIIEDDGNGVVDDPWSPARAAMTTGIAAGPVYDTLIAGALDGVYLVQQWRRLEPTPSGGHAFLVIKTGGAWWKLHSTSVGGVGPTFERFVKGRGVLRAVRLRENT